MDRKDRTHRPQADILRRAAHYVSNLQRHAAALEVRLAALEGTALPSITLPVSSYSHSMIVSCQKQSGADISPVETTSPTKRRGADNGSDDEDDTEFTPTRAKRESQGTYAPCAIMHRLIADIDSVIGTAPADPMMVFFRALEMVESRGTTTPSDDAVHSDDSAATTTPTHDDDLHTSSDDIIVPSTPEM